MVVKGSCVCGQTTFEYTGDYSAFVACHCIPCRKTSGADRSLNLIIPKSAITVTPPEKVWARKADSGNELAYHQCGTCGSIVYSEPKAAPQIVILKIGLIDDKEFLDSLGTPKKHIYCKNLWSWEKPFEGAEVAQVS